MVFLLFGAAGAVGLAFGVVWNQREHQKIRELTAAEMARDMREEVDAREVDARVDIDRRARNLAVLRYDDEETPSQVFLRLMRAHGAPHNAASTVDTVRQVHRFAATEARRRRRVEEALAGLNESHVNVVCESGEGGASTRVRAPLCVVCQTDPATHAQARCGHVALCGSCYFEVQQSCPRCPVCRDPAAHTGLVVISLPLVVASQDPTTR